jgi:energy-coupling factor transporter ATP-binding protein EcfA2
MQIKRVRIQDFRSIKSLDLAIDSPYLVLEGKNDTGKSNIVHAINLALRHASAASWPRGENSPYAFSEWPDRFAGRQTTIFRQGTSVAQVALDLSLSEDERAHVHSVSSLNVTVTWRIDARNLVTYEVLLSLPPSEPNLNPLEMQRLSWMLFWALRLVDAHRKPRDENYNPSSNEAADALPIWRGDNLKSLLFSFKNHIVPGVQENFERLIEKCKDPDFPVGDLTVGVSGGNRLFARTRHAGMILDLEDRSDGVQQLIFLLALSVCHTGSIVAIEEPEAHLNVDLQKKFWSKLKEMVGHGIDQVFVTSHSPVFELESSRVVVSRGEDGFTKATPAPKVLPAPHNYDHLQVRRDGSVELPAAIRERLGVEGEGGTLFVDTGPSHEGILRLLTPEAWTKETEEGGQ